jgi:hypothetical protein
MYDQHPAMIVRRGRQAAACGPSLRTVRWPAESSGSAKGKTTARGKKQGKATAASRKTAAKDGHTEAAVAKPANKRNKRKA